MYVDYLPSPLGQIEITATNQGIMSLYFHFQPDTQRVSSNSLTNNAKQQVKEYFSGKRHRFNLPLDLKGTLFQRSVWQELLKIEFGECRTYSDIANSIQNPKAVRAVGAANGKNPISIIVPCHRVIGSNGKLTGYAGGLERKEWLLEHEKLYGHPR